MYRTTNTAFGGARARREGSDIDISETVDVRRGQLSMYASWFPWRRGLVLCSGHNGGRTRCQRHGGGGVGGWTYDGRREAEAGVTMRRGRETAEDAATVMNDWPIVTDIAWTVDTGDEERMLDA
ncbi:hypothetical protein M407DRAFT_8921 [Tulasnella calospora MUT 4182]|uniref:Uncharacterized protein n=1 Tax=Tulasnella calospora MUT 4182 TaxID=1051891 RepID=A0A0C3KSR0_9AGAM|nr:hypothetical protein M407DRAFT_8921 [Tulasnella calospora MUT 4182]